MVIVTPFSSLQFMCTLLSFPPPTNICCTSSTSLPLVSGTSINTKTVPTPQTPPNIQKVGPNPRELAMFWNSFVTVNARIQLKAAEVDPAMPFVLLVNSSPIIIQGIGPKPIEKRTMKTATLITGTEAYAERSVVDLR